LCIHVGDPCSGADPLADPPARLATRLPLVVEEGPAHNRLRSRVGRMVALRRDSDESFTKAEGEADLRGRREEGHDPHAFEAGRPRATKKDCSSVLVWHIQNG